MKTKMKLPAVLVMLALLAAINSQLSTVHAQGATAFTYQGQLRDGGTNAYGAYTMIFKLYDACTGGNQIGGTITNAPTLANGLFTVNLDFGGDAFNGNARWLDITVDGESLTPRVQVLPSPYAIYAGNAASAANLSSGTWSAAAGNFEGYSNVFGIFANNNVVLGMSTNGCMLNGHLDVNGMEVHGELDLTDSLNFNNGGNITGDGMNGLNISGAVQVGSDLNASGNLYANGNVSAGGDVNAGNLFLGGFGGGAIWGSSDGSLTFNDGAAGIDWTGNIYTYGQINVNHGTAVISPNGNITLTGGWLNAFGGNFTSWVTALGYNTTSDRNLKEKFTSVDSRDVLARVVRLPISSWSFKSEPATRHIGPMAQDFYAAFNIGTDDRHIATVDESGVALAAIQGLNQKLDEKDAEIQKLKLQNADLEKRLANLEALVTSPAH